MRMIKLIVPFFTVTIFLSKWVYAQDDRLLDNSLMECKYRYTFYPDSNKTLGAVISDMVLQIGHNISRFSEQVSIINDSLLYYDRFVKDPNLMSKIVQNLANSNSHAFSCYSVYKNYPGKGDLYFIRIFSRNEHYCVKDNERITWKIENSCDTVILGYACKKATTYFRGRSYTAWFSPDIPISDGPYKFRGLPGLILMIYDSQGFHKFEMVGISNKPGSSAPILFENIPNCFDITPIEFVKLFYGRNMEFYNKVKRNEAGITLGKEDQAQLLRKIKSWNNYIEKF